jgi:hypothetical protein
LIIVCIMCFTELLSKVDVSSIICQGHNIFEVLYIVLKINIQKDTWDLLVTGP